MVMEGKVVERAHNKPAACLPSAPGQRELPAAARKSDLPLSRFPLRGKAGAGGFPPRRWHAGRQRDRVQMVRLDLRDRAGEKIKDGCHVGLDFYDLLIEVAE